MIKIKSDSFKCDILQNDTEYSTKFSSKNLTESDELTAVGMVWASGERLCRLSTSTAIDTDTVHRIMTHAK